MGWLMSGRAFIGVMVLAVWAGIYWSTLFILLAVTSAGAVGIGITRRSLDRPARCSAASRCYRTYMSAAREMVAEEPAAE